MSEFQDWMPVRPNLQEYENETLPTQPNNFVNYSLVRHEITLISK